MTLRACGAWFLMPRPRNKALPVGLIVGMELVSSSFSTILVFAFRIICLILLGEEK